MLPKSVGDHGPDAGIGKNLQKSYMRDSAVYQVRARNPILHGADTCLCFGDHSIRCLLYTSDAADE